MKQNAFIVSWLDIGAIFAAGFLLGFITAAGVLS